MRAEVRGREQEGGGVVDEAAEHFADFLAQAGEFAVLLGGDVAAVAGEVERRVGFAVFAVTVCELADEVGFVTSFGPGLTQVEADRPR